MRKLIKIRNLKSIESLDFKIPSPGVHLLAGSNGAGKTTLLACLRRIRQSNSFQIHFQTSLKSKKLDSFIHAEVTYILDERSVAYAYAGERWVPRPRSASNLVEEFGYPEVLYVGATASRLTPRPEDFLPSRMRPAHSSIVKAANEIFDTNRFSELKTINLTTGNKNQAFVLVVRSAGQQRINYVSEKNLSLGELCVLKLLRELNDCHNGTLVLIDELELALHPRAQVGLIGYLETLAREKALTVIVSTHSVTLLKNAPRRKITFLDKREGRTEVLTGCFPAFALGSIALSEERTPDAVIYVEDESARYVTESLINLCISDQFASTQGIFPTIRVLPVGGFKDVVRFYDRNRAVLPSHVKQWVLLDKDVEDESVSIIDSSSDNPLRDVFHRSASVLRYLPWSPEVGMMGFLANQRSNVQQELRRKYLNAQILLTPAMVSITSTGPGSALRSESKRLLREIIQQIHDQSTNVTKESITDFLFTLFAQWFFTTNRPQAMQLFGPMIA